MEETYLHSLEKISLADIVKSEYRTYQIYTLMDRAIPHLQDGLKPSQRRILYTLFKNKAKGLMKVSGVTGQVLTLHPHGPASIESAVINLAQDFAFSNNYPLIDKKGYFGERMETQAAAGRYIECKLGKVAELLLFDDLNQVKMIPNYDERATEPQELLPKLPIMLLNGAEGIGTGFSSAIPAFKHTDIINSMIFYIERGKARKLVPWNRYYDQKTEQDKSGRIIYRTRFEKRGDKIFITELPKGYDAKKVYNYLNKHIEADFIKDYVDSSVDNHIEIELIFKRGKQPPIDVVEKNMGVKSTLVPNYTLISERGVRIFSKAEEIIELFTEQRLKVVKKRYELLVEECDYNIEKNNEIIRFIKEKHYAQAEKKANRSSFVDYLKQKKFKFGEYLVDMAIYRMTKEEVSKRELLIKEDKTKLKSYKAILKSKEKIKEKLIDELNDVNVKLSKIMDDKEKQKKNTLKKAKAKKK